MLNRLLHGKIRRFEREFDYDMAYAHEMLDISRTAFLRFARVTGMSQHREDAPLAAYYAAKITAALSEDCGPCAQLVTTMAERAGVAPAVLRAIVEGNIAAMGEEAALGWRYASAVLAHDPQADELRMQITRRWGSKAVVSLAMAITTARLFPTLKYALGHGHACSRIRAGGIDATPRKPSLYREPAAA